MKQSVRKSDTIDKGIKGYCNIINSFGFVKTCLSCAGHFLKHPIKSPFTFYKNGEAGYTILSTIRSKVSYPYIILKFPDKRMKKQFIITWIKFRRIIWKKYKEFLYILNERNRKYIKSKSPISLPNKCYAVSSFGNYVAISYIFNCTTKYPYSRNKLFMNKFIKWNRDGLFCNVINTLSYSVCKLARIDSYIKK